MNEASSIQPEFPVTQEEFDVAWMSVERSSQATEIELRKALMRFDELFERIGDEVVARLNEEQIEPDDRQVFQIVQAVFEKYFGKSVRVRVEAELAKSSSKLPQHLKEEGRKPD